MSKVKTLYVCQNCSATFPKWMGKCTQCDSWNTIEEQVVEQRRGSLSKKSQASIKEPTNQYGRQKSMRQLTK